MADPASPRPAIPSSLTPPSDHHRILSLTIEGGTHFPSFHADFSDGLNCLIGGRGAGKTAVLLHIAFALGFVTSPLSAQRSDAHLRSNLGVGRVTVKVRTSHGRVFTSRRSAGEPPCVRDDEGNVVPVSLNGELFKIDAYGQSEIEKMGDSPLAQLTLLDKFAAADVRRATDAIAQIERRLSTNAAEMKRLDGEIADAEESTGDLPSIEAALAGLDASAGPDAAEGKRAHDAKVVRGRERAAIDTVAKEIASVERALAATTSEARRRLGGAVHGQLEQGANGALFTRVHLQAKAVADKLEQLQTELAATVAAASAAVAVDERALHVFHANADDAYKTLSLRIETDGKRVAERDKLQRRMVELSGVAKVLSDRRAEAATRATERRALRDDLEREQAARFAVRASVAEYLTTALDGEIRVSITRGGDTGAYKDLLDELLQGANIRPPGVIAEIAKNIRPDELFDLVRANDTARIVALDDAKTNKAERAQKIVSVLAASGRLYELETVELRDMPRIELKMVDGYASAGAVSPGERCATILPILLLESASPLLIDQPEDQIDPPYIYGAVVKGIVRGKANRQLLFVTHNPNIPVLGDAERVFKLATTPRGKGAIVRTGDVDELRDELEALEGGPAAFVRRGQRYGYRTERSS